MLDRSLQEKIDNATLKAKQKEIEQAKLAEESALPIKIEEKWDVRISNQLIRAAHKLTIAEKRIIHAAIPSLRNSRVVVLSASDFSQVYDLETQTAYEQLKNAAEQIFNRYIAFEDSTGLEKIRWVSSAKYMSRKGCVRLSFSEEIIPHLLNLEQQYTKYNLTQTKALKSIFSWRLFELLTQWHSTSIMLITIENLLHALELDPVYYGSNFSRLRTKILEPAIRELYLKNNLIIKFDMIKTGRKVTSLKFNFKYEEQQKLNI